MIITIDGYAGTGKSSAARALAVRLNFELLNTGAMYRAVGYLLLRAGINLHAAPRDEAAIRAIVDTAVFSFPANDVCVNGENLASVINSEEIGAAASKVGTFAEVRSRLKDEQRRLAAGRDMVCEGRDQGTAVFPDAAMKFFLHATVEVRATRRQLQLSQAGQRTALDVLIQQIRERDHQDETRSLDPLRAADDAIRIDTTNLSAAEVLELLAQHVQRVRNS